MPVLLDVAGLLTDCNMGPIAGVRRGVPTKSKYGDAEAAAPMAIEFNPCVWHTVTGRDLLQVPEADRNTEIIELYTDERVHVSDAGFVPDEITIEGRVFRAITPNNYKQAGGVYFTFFALEDVQS